MRRRTRPVADQAARLERAEGGILQRRDQETQKKYRQRLRDTQRESMADSSTRLAAIREALSNQTIRTDGALAETSGGRQAARLLDAVLAGTWEGRRQPTISWVADPNAWQGIGHVPYLQKDNRRVQIPDSWAYREEDFPTEGNAPFAALIRWSTAVLLVQLQQYEDASGFLRGCDLVQLANECQSKPGVLAHNLVCMLLRVFDSIKTSRGSQLTIRDCPQFDLLRDMLQVRGSRTQSQRGSKDSRGGGLRICGQHLARDTGNCRGGAPYGNSNCNIKPPLRESTCAHRDRVRRAPLPDDIAIHPRAPAEWQTRKDNHGRSHLFCFRGGPGNHPSFQEVHAAVGRAGRVGASKSGNPHTGR